MNQGVVNLGINSQTERQALVTAEASHPQVENLGSLPPSVKKGQEVLGPFVINRRESVAWAAGFIDGEGRIGINKRHPNLKTRNISPTYFVSLQARNVKLGPMLRLRELFGGWVTTKTQEKRKARPLFQWEVSCRKAIACLQELLPYLTCKSQQARLVIEWRSLPITGRRFTASELTQRELYFQKLKILNARGVTSCNKAKQLEYSGLGVLLLALF